MRWSKLTDEQRQLYRDAVRAGIAHKFRPLTPEEQARLARLGKRRSLRDLDVQDVPRCPVCTLLEPHACLDQVEVRPL